MTVVDIEFSNHPVAYLESTPNPIATPAAIAAEYEGAAGVRRPSLGSQSAGHSDGV
jgi:hypothetical protein